MTWWQNALQSVQPRLQQLFAGEKQENAKLADHEQRLQRMEKFMTTFSDDVTQLETLVPAIIARDQKDEADLATAQGLVADLTKQRDTALANAADPATVKRLEVQIAALTQFMTPTPVVTTDPAASTAGTTDTATAAATS